MAAILKSSLKAGFARAPRAQRVRSAANACVPAACLGPSAETPSHALCPSQATAQVARAIEWYGESRKIAPLHCALVVPCSRANLVQRLTLVRLPCLPV